MATHPCNRSTCIAWASGEAEGRAKGGNIFFRDGTIYSYGHHFPMASILCGWGDRNAVLVTHATYSVTTSKHQSYMRSAILTDGPRPFHLFTVADCTSKPDHAANVADYGERVRTCLDRADRARSRRAEHLQTARLLIAERERYCQHFGLDVPAPEPLPLDADEFVCGARETRDFRTPDTTPIA